MYLKKRIISVGAVFLLIAGVVFGSSREMRGIKESNIVGTLFGGARGKETIYFWYTDDNMTSFFNSAAVAFGEKKGVRVLPVLTSDSEYLEAVNDASLHGEHMPDVYIIGHDSLEKAYLSGLAAVLDDDKNICTLDSFPQAALDAVSYHKRKVAYPWNFITSALVYNKSYLQTWAEQQAVRELSGEDAEGEEGEEAPDASGTETTEPDAEQVAALAQQYFERAVPATVDDILQFADSFDAPEGVEVMKWDVSDLSYNYWIVGNYMIVGGEAGDDGTAININNGETVQCLEAYKALNQFFSIETDTITYESVIQDFIDGRIVFTVGTPDVIKRLEDARADGSFDFEYGIATMPDVSAELAGRSLSVTETVAVNGYSRHRKLANEFAAYLVTECAQGLYDKTGKIPAYLKVNAENEMIDAFKAEYADSISLPKMMKTGNYWLQLEVLFSKIWNGGDIPTLVQELDSQIAAQTGKQ